MPLQVKRREGVRKKDEDKLIWGREREREGTIAKKKVGKGREKTIRQKWS